VNLHDDSSRAWLQKAFYTIRTPALVAALYYLGAEAAFAIGTLSDRIFAPFWPPNVVLFCALVLAPKRRWWIYIAATFPAHTIAELMVGMPMGQLLVAFATNCILAMLNAVGVRRYLLEPPWFGTLRNASIYVLLTAGINPAISALGGAFVQILGGGPFGSYWAYAGNWYMSNALGSMTLGPVCLIWLDRRSWADRMSTRRIIEAGVLAVGLGVVCAIVLNSGGKVESGFLPAILYGPLPLLLWAAVRFGQRGVSGAILVLTIVSIWQNLRSPTLFIGIGPERSVLALQVFLMGIAVPLFFLGAAIDQLRRTGEAMRELAGALLHVQDEERRRIARELHDSTGQNLAVAGLMMSRVQGTLPEALVPVMGEVHEILRQSMAEIRTASYLLHPPFIDGVGLASSLRSYLDGFTKRTGLTVDFDAPAENERMPASIELALFRVLQEALTNVWRHSGSSSAMVRLEQRLSDDGHQVILSIEDLGKGIPTKIRQSTLSRGSVGYGTAMGLGLVSMRERLLQIGGSLEIDSHIGRTVIRAVVTFEPVNK